MSWLVSALLARQRRLAAGWVEIDGTHLGGVGHGPAPREPDERLDGILAPGLYDLQVNGAGGHEVSGGPAALDAVDAVQLAHGVTSYLPTLISPDSETAERVLPQLAERTADPSSPVAGVHLEGPFLSREHAGMHPVGRLRSPAEGVPDWVEHPAVRLVTLAPELPGALELIARLRERGIAVALGHTGASSEIARAAIDSGARAVTHIFNAMAPLDHQAPGLVAIALLDPRVHVSVIADGVHVHPLVLELVRVATAARATLATDATPAAAARPGRYQMGGVLIDGYEDAARTAEGVLAGSILTLDHAVRNWTAMTEATLAEALFAASEAPAAVAGRCDPTAAGAPADLVLLDRGGAIQRVMRGGKWLGEEAAWRAIR
ncbi:MAG: N-acetylglucosamine-6-phosphate deacetylase [Actinobacteria bacterium]|nr:MAG: N-acetylglucosamine-6-phosphate deacetylase [Actinomycetota bacterium]